MAEKDDILNEKNKREESEEETVDTIKGQIVSTLLLLDPDYNNIKNTNPEKLQILRGKYKISVEQTISIAHEKLEESLPQNTFLPEETDFFIAKKILKAVEQRGKRGIEEVKSDEKTIREILADSGVNRIDGEIEETGPEDLNNPNLLEMENLKNIIINLNHAKDEIAPVIFEKAHDESATESEKQMPGALMFTDKIDDLLSYGLTYDKLDDLDKGFVIAAIKMLQENGKSDLANQYASLLKISKEELDKKQEVTSNFELDTYNENEDAIARTIRKDSEKLTNFFKYASKEMSEEEQAIKLDEILKGIEENEYGIDAIFDFFSTSDIRGELDYKDSRVKKILDFATKKLESKENNVEIDGYFALNYLYTAYQIAQVDPDKSKYFINILNQRIKMADSTAKEFEFGKLMKFSEREIEFLGENLPDSEQNNTYQYIYNEIDRIANKEMNIKNSENQDERKDKEELYNSKSKESILFDSMLESVITSSDCGRFKDDLSSVAKTILFSRQRNGIKINEHEIKSVGEEVFLAYQAILSVATDEESISEAVTSLVKEAQSGNLEVSKNALRVAKKAVEHTAMYNGKYETKELIREDEIEDYMGLFEGLDISIEEKQENIEELFSGAVSEKVDNLLDKIKKGDYKALVALEVLNQTTNFFGENPILNDENMPQAMILLKRMLVTNSTTCGEAMVNIVKQWKLPLLKKGENGKDVIDTDAFQKMFERHHPELADKPDEYFTEINNEDTDKAIENGKYDDISEWTSENIMELQKDELKKTQIGKNILRKLQEGDFNGIEVIAHENTRLYNAIVRDVANTKKLGGIFLDGGKINRAISPEAAMTLLGEIAKKSIPDILPYAQRYIPRKGYEFPKTAIRTALRNSESIEEFQSPSFDFQKNQKGALGEDDGDIEFE